MEQYKYKPWKFYSIVIVLTWAFWVPAAFIKSEVAFMFMALGLFVSPIVAAVMVFTSKNKLLKEDYKQKLVGYYRLKPANILSSILLFSVI